MAGFWGPVTSSVDWCEANYVHSRFVAEWFNTLSSLAMVAVGMVGAWLHRRVLERRFLCAFGLVALVGLGSVAFHATLRFGLQMMDELPMLYLVTLIVFILIEDGPAPRHGRWLPALAWSYVAVLTVLCSVSRGQVEFFVFQVSFTSLELFALGRVWWLQRSLEAPTRRLYRLGMGAYALAIVCWLVDLKGCAFVSGALPWNPQLHAWWHVLVSAGFYLLLLVIASHRLRVLGLDREVVFSPVPALRGGLQRPGVGRSNRTVGSVL